MIHQSRHLYSKYWSPLAYSQVLSLFLFHPSETRLSLSIHRFSPTVSRERALSSSESLCFPTGCNVPHPLAITILLKDWILCEMQPFVWGCGMTGTNYTSCLRILCDSNHCRLPNIEVVRACSCSEPNSWVWEAQKNAYTQTLHLLGRGIQ